MPRSINRCLCFFLLSELSHVLTERPEHLLGVLGHVCTEHPKHLLT
jgi:hypothetical protein